MSTVVDGVDTPATDITPALPAPEEVKPKGEPRVAEGPGSAAASDSYRRRKLLTDNEKIELAKTKLSICGLDDDDNVKDLLLLAARAEWLQKQRDESFKSGVTSYGRAGSRPIYSGAGSGSSGQYLGANDYRNQACGHPYADRKFATIGGASYCAVCEMKDDYNQQIDDLKEGLTLLLDVINMPEIREYFAYLVESEITEPVADGEIEFAPSLPLPDGWDTVIRQRARKFLEDDAIPPTAESADASDTERAFN